MEKNHLTKKPVEITLVVLAVLLWGGREIVNFLQINH